MKKEDVLLKHFGKFYSEELGIQVKKGWKEIFKWFLASLLFGKPIGENLVKRTYRQFEKARLLDPGSILKAGWDRLVEILDAGGYVRYDFSTADKLLEIMRYLEKNPLRKIYGSARDSQELEKELEKIKGIGPTTVNIFLRELRHVLKKADPEISPLALLAAERFGIKLEKQKTEEFARLETALLRLGKNFCRKRRCGSCPVRKFCSNPF
ncbi:MAG: hypothetical protein DRP12_02360 [Candidatus Aenigmatarchaeota archaeon]|nr:MAG: hypothetical protein DRP12_02360 [Candidatus Aenigmarchaeota archaeon]